MKGVYLVEAGDELCQALPVFLLRGEEGDGS